MFAAFFGKEIMPRIINRCYKDLKWVFKYGGKIKRVHIDYQPKRKTIVVWTHEIKTKHK